MFSQTAEYALRAVAALAVRMDQLVPTSELSKATDVPPPYLAKVLQQLASADLIRGRRGVGGGYRLVRDPSEITLLEVVNAVSAIRKPRVSADAEQGFGRLNETLDGVAGRVVEQFATVRVSEIAQRVVEAAPSNGLHAGNGSMAHAAAGNGH